MLSELVPKAGLVCELALFSGFLSQVVSQLLEHLHLLPAKPKSVWSHHRDVTRMSAIQTVQTPPCLKWSVPSLQNLRKRMPKPKLQYLEDQPLRPVNHLFPYQMESKRCPRLPAPLLENQSTLRHMDLNGKVNSLPLKKKKKKKKTEERGKKVSDFPGCATFLVYQI